MIYNFTFPIDSNFAVVSTLLSAFRNSNTLLWKIENTLSNVYLLRFHVKNCFSDLFYITNSHTTNSTALCSLKHVLWKSIKFCIEQVLVSNNKKSFSKVIRVLFSENHTKNIKKFVYLLHSAERIEANLNFLFVTSL